MKPKTHAPSQKWEGKKNKSKSESLISRQPCIIFVVNIFYFVYECILVFNMVYLYKVNILIKNKKKVTTTGEMWEGVNESDKRKKELMWKVKWCDNYLYYKGLNLLKHMLTNIHISHHEVNSDLYFNVSYIELGHISYEILLVQYIEVFKGQQC